MKRIILNHLRRWWWLWLVIGIANSFSVGAFYDENHHFNGLTFQLILWIGAMQLSFDLQRGISRVQTTLPVTAKQIGRAWWIISVALPAIFLITTSAVAMLLHAFHAPGGFPWDSFILNATASVIFLGSMFFLFLGMLPAWPQTQAEWLRYIGSMAGIFGMIFIPPGFDTPKGTLVLLAGTIFTLAGWFRAEQLVLLRATYKTGIQTGKHPAGQYKVSGGYGGVSFLVQTLFTRFARFVLIFIAYMMLIQLFEGKALSFSPQETLAAILPALSSFGVFFLYMTLLAPVILQLRQLRTLPISTASLASLLVLLPVIPVLVVGIASQLVGANHPVHANFMVGSANYLAYAAILAGTVPLIVWRGMRIETIVLLMLLPAAIMLGPLTLHSLTIPQPVIALVSLAVILLAIEITRRLLKCSSHAYRTPPTSVSGWGGWR